MKFKVLKVFKAVWQPVVDRDWDRNGIESKKSGSGRDRDFMNHKHVDLKQLMIML